MQGPYPETLKRWVLKCCDLSSSQSQVQVHLQLSLSHGLFQFHLNRWSEHELRQHIQIMGSADYHTLQDEEISDNPDYLNTIPPMDIKGKTVLILGAWGLVGSAIARRIVQEKPKNLSLIHI